MSELLRQIRAKIDADLVFRRAVQNAVELSNRETADKSVDDVEAVLSALSFLKVFSMLRDDEYVERVYDVAAEACTDLIEDKGGEFIALEMLDQSMPPNKVREISAEKRVEFVKGFMHVTKEMLKNELPSSVVTLLKERFGEVVYNNATAATGENNA